MKNFPFSVYCLASCVIRPYETKDFFVKSSSHSDREKTCHSSAAKNFPSRNGGHCY